VDELPASALALAARIAGDAVADAPEAGGLLDVEVDELAGACAAVTPRRGAARADRRPPNRRRQTEAVVADRRQ
jgi:hypothetical protein